MPSVLNRVSGSATILNVNSFVEVNLGTGWTLSRSFVTFGISCPTTSGYYEASCVTGQLSTSGSDLIARFERASSGVFVELTINYTVIELSGITVQRGSVTFNQLDTTKTATISSVTTSKTFIIATGRTNITSADPVYFLFTALVSSSILLTFQRELTPPGSQQLYVEYQCITIPDIVSKAVYTGSVTSAGSNQTDITITSVDLTKSIIIPYYRTSFSGMQGQHFRETHFTSSTNVRFEAYTNITSAALYYSFVVLTFPTAKVNRGYSAFTTGNTSEVVSIGATIDTTKCMARLMGQQQICEAYTANQDAGDTHMRISALSTTQLTATRGKSGVAAYFAWEIIEFGVLSGVKKWEHYRKQFIRQ